jgi:ABC-type uncharacterized transport system ATPase subunit
MRKLSSLNVRATFETKEVMKEFRAFDAYKQDGNVATFRVPKENLSETLAKLSQTPLVDLAIQEPTLEDLFIEFYEDAGDVHEK